MPLLQACGGPVLGPDYTGEPLMTIRGEVILQEDGRGDGPTRAAVLWMSASPYGLAIRADDAPIEADFPADYEVSVNRIPTDDELPGRWRSVPYLPEAEEVRTIFGVLIAYVDGDHNDQADFDYSGFALLDWIGGRVQTVDDVLLGDDELVGLAPDLLVAAAVLPDGAAVLGDAVPLDETPELAAIHELQDGLFPYAWDEGSGTWQIRDDADQVPLYLGTPP